MNEMRSYSLKHGRIFMISDLVLLTGFLNNTTNGRIVNMTYLRKQVMLDLKVQPSQHPEK